MNQQKHTLAKGLLFIITLLGISLFANSSSPKGSISFFSTIDTALVASQSDSAAIDTTVKKTKIYLEHSNTLSFDQKRNPDAQLLIGDVRFRHDSSYMYCDSAYFDEKRNSLEAFSNVRMEQGDTLFIYGDYLRYNGENRMAYLRKNVRMENRDVTLLTDSLNYDRMADLGYYFGGGEVIDPENRLTSLFGRYSPTAKLSFFKDSVKLTNSQLVMTSDTLEYHTEQKIATIHGPSVIVSDSGTIYTSQGWYDTVEDKSLLLDRSKVESGETILTGDSILYDRLNNIGEVFGKMVMIDTLQNVTLEGDYGYYNGQVQYSFATIDARMLEYSEGTDTLYLHGDTLEMRMVDNQREVKAFYDVRFYRRDLQGVCDSLRINSRDSVLYMYDNPVLWSGRNQMSGDTIEVFMKDSTVDYTHIKGYAFAIESLDSSYHNQLKGKELKAYFDGQMVKRIEVEGNAQSIYYPLENDGNKLGLNRTESGFLTIWMEDGMLDRLKIWPSPVSMMIPIPDLNPEEKELEGFIWFDYLRPYTPDDVLRIVERKIEDAAPTRSQRFQRE